MYVNLLVYLEKHVENMTVFIGEMKIEDGPLTFFKLSKIFQKGFFKNIGNISTLNYKF